MWRRGGAALRTSLRSILQYAQPQDEPLRNPPTSPATSRTRHCSSSAGSTYPPPYRLLLSASISALLCLTYHPAPGPKESHFHRVAIQIQNFRDLLDRISFHFLQDQHQPVTFIQSFQQTLHVLPRFHLFADIRSRVLLIRRRDDQPGLFLAQVGFKYQGPNLLLSQQIPAFIHRDLIQPSAECRPLIKPLQRKIRLYKNLLDRKSTRLNSSH